jgi:hypothetical protein
MRRVRQRASWSPWRTASASSSSTTLSVAAQAMLAVTIGAGCARATQEPATVILRPGQSIQRAVESAPEGTTFRLEPGTYRQQTIQPRNRQRFIGEGEVILNGAMELQSWTRHGDFWLSAALPPALPFHGECDASQPLCGHREDLFVDNSLYRRVMSLAELGPGRWYREADRAYVADDPSQRSVELGATPQAFGGDAEGVVLESLIVEKYASDAQYGAIYGDDARGWLIANVTARWNHGVGLSFGSSTRVIGGSFSHNGQLGIGGIGEGSTIQGVEIAFNNYAGYDSDWEAGGTKFWETIGLVVRDSCVHHNGGPGLWSDKDNIDLLYDNNKVFLNAREGVKHEISSRAIIRNNIVTHNGTSRFDQWLWGSQILIQNSNNVQAYRNLIEVSGSFGNGIGVIYQDRGHGDYGPWDATNNKIYDNTIVYLGRRGQSGIVTDTGDNGIWRSASNEFDYNHYIVTSGTTEYWTTRNQDARWSEIRELGLERNSELIVAQPTPVTLVCKR